MSALTFWTYDIGLYLNLFEIERNLHNKYTMDKKYNSKQPIVTYSFVSFAY